MGAFGWRRTRDAGHSVEMGPSRALRTASALRCSGTTETQLAALKRPEHVTVRASFGDGIDIREMTFARLLRSGALVEHHSLHDGRVFSSRRIWIVKSDVAVFAKSDKRHVHGSFGQHP